VRRERHGVLAFVGAALSLLVTLTAAAQTTTYIFTPIDVPAAREVILSGINNAGQIVGYYEDDAFTYHGLFYSDGSSFTTIDVPGGGTLALGINNAGQIVGIGGVGGFLLDTDGTYRTFAVPGYCCTEAYGINDSGQIVGSFVYYNGFDIYASHGFLYSAGNFTIIDAPGADQFYGNTYPRGINNAGQIVGYFDGGNGPPQHGYLFDTDASYTTIDVPGSGGYTWVFGINNAGQIVGTGAGGAGGFLYSGGSFTTIVAPGGLGTEPFGINDAGQIVLRTTRFQWFVATPAQSPGLARLLGRPSTNQPNALKGGSNVFASPAKSNR
jgi:probable HAF family extracellular repeat protein